MAKIALLFLCLAFATIEESFALKCKMCKDPPTCASLEDQTCPAPAANMEAACLIHIYKADKDSKEELVEKKCVNRNKDGKFDCIKQKSTEVEVTCRTCTDDLCNEKNAAPRIAMGSLAAFGVVLALLAPKFL